MIVSKKNGGLQWIMKIKLFRFSTGASFTFVDEQICKAVVVFFKFWVFDEQFEGV